MSAVEKLSKKTQRELALEAMNTAQELGYCDATRRVLERMGFELEDEQKTIVVTVTTEVPFGLDLQNCSTYLQFENDLGELLEIYDDLKIEVKE